MGLLQHFCSKKDLEFDLIFTDFYTKKQNLFLQRFLSLFESYGHLVKFYFECLLKHSGYL